jgi:hypothetical protein
MIGALANRKAGAIMSEDPDQEPSSPPERGDQGPGREGEEEGGELVAGRGLSPKVFWRNLFAIAILGGLFALAGGLGLASIPAGLLIGAVGGIGMWFGVPKDKRSQLIRRFR